MTDLSHSPRLELSGISKYFSGVTALEDVDIELYPGEIHALLGENGAGKSTLIRVLTGGYLSDAGSFRINGQNVSITSPRDAIRQGISLVPQDILFVPNFSIGRNMLLGMEGRGSRRDSLSQRERSLVEDALSRLGAKIDVDAPASTVPVPQLRLAQVARGLLQGGDIMVLDEPTAVLSEPDAEMLLERLEGLRTMGTAILYVTHRLNEVLRIADRTTILRDGKRVGVYKRGALKREDMVELIARSLPDETTRPARRVAEKVDELDAPRLSVRNFSSGIIFRDCNLDVRPGEIIGIAGVQGSGHGAFLRSLGGLDPVDSGTLRVNGASIRTGNVARSVGAAVMTVPADRRGSSIIADMSIRANLAVSGRSRAGMSRWGIRKQACEREMTRTYIERMSIRPNAQDALLGQMSGGNQQKVAIARALDAEPEVLLIEEPTQGVDVGTKADIHDLLREAATLRNCAVVVASSECEELLELCDSIAVMRIGKLTAPELASAMDYKSLLARVLP
ncbi:sugar ABC transporter ATP-binding protein [Sulfitobacter geojensis]|uniref:sugar ABC transporter ATP-binding protein n=1 Tax=Sulfitobacter geojensis TaxID=1342299 RepID=UPI000468A267|nr:sugar ABC transporter ATP-binding protein [Sulfitobacter geojensis]KHA54093.1 ABC transporter [Sulfitobacter geojensis]NYI29911.1 ABC-type sugar transport system ATPase subunit [Sulfitobacter geojensis]